MAQLTEKLRFDKVYCNDSGLWLKWLNSRGAWQYEYLADVREDAVALNEQATGMANSTDNWLAQQGEELITGADTQQSVTCYIQPIKAEYKARYLDFISQTQHENAYVCKQPPAFDAGLDVSAWQRVRVQNIDSNFKGNSSLFYLKFTLLYSPDIS